MWPFPCETLKLVFILSLTDIPDIPLLSIGQTFTSVRSTVNSLFVADITA